MNSQFLVHQLTMSFLEKILDGLGEDYKELVHAIQTKGNLISFKELHENLLNFEAFL